MCSPAVLAHDRLGGAIWPLPVARLARIPQQHLLPASKGAVTTGELRVLRLWIYSCAAILSSSMPCDSDTLTAWGLLQAVSPEHTFHQPPCC